MRHDIDLADLLDDLLRDNILLLLQNRLEMTELQRLIQEVLLYLTKLSIWEALIDFLV